MKTIKEIQAEELELKRELIKNIRSITHEGVNYEYFLGKHTFTFILVSDEETVEKLTIHELYNLYSIIDTGNANNISEKYNEIANFSSHLSESINSFLDSDGENDPTLVITLKGRSIQLPWYPETADALEKLLQAVMNAEEELNS